MVLWRRNKNELSPTFPFKYDDDGTYVYHHHNNNIQRYGESIVHALPLPTKSSASEFIYDIMFFIKIKVFSLNMSNIDWIETYVPSSNITQETEESETFIKNLVIPHLTSTTIMLIKSNFFLECMCLSYSNHIIIYHKINIYFV